MLPCLTIVYQEHKTGPRDGNGPPQPSHATGRPCPATTTYVRHQAAMTASQKGGRGFFSNERVVGETSSWS